MRNYLFLLLFVFSNSHADEVTLQVKAVKYTGTPYLRDCGEDCITFDSWHVYTVQVKKVIEGEFDHKKIKVAVVEHAPRKLWSRKNWKIVIDQFKDKENIEKFGTKYFVVRQPNDT